MGSKNFLRRVQQDMRCAAKPGALGLGIYGPERIAAIAHTGGVRVRVIHRMLKRAAETPYKEEWPSYPEKPS